MMYLVVLELTSRPEYPELERALKALGNAVIPDVAALAWRVLSARVRSEAA